MRSSLQGMTLGNVGGFGAFGDDFEQILTPTNPWGPCPEGYVKVGESMLGTTRCAADFASCPENTVPGPSGGCVDVGGSRLCPAGTAWDIVSKSCVNLVIPSDCERKGGFVGPQGDCFDRDGKLVGVTPTPDKVKPGPNGPVIKPGVVSPPEETPWGTYAAVAAAVVAVGWIWNKRRQRQGF